MKDIELISNEINKLLDEVKETIKKEGKEEDYADNLKQLLKRLDNNEYENYIVMVPEGTAINGDFLTLLAMVDRLIEDLAKDLEISKEELCKLLSF